MIEQKSNWFGSIPKEWSVTSLKKAISLAYRYPTYYGIDYVDDGILEVRGEMLRTDGQISLENSSPRYISLETSNRFPLTILEKGDLVISVRGTIGKVGIVDEDIAGSNITANLLRLKIIKKLFVPEYLFWLIRNHVFLAHLNNVSDSTTIKTITLPTFLSIEIPSPTLLVQNKIVKYLNQKVQSIDNIVVQKQNLINLLEQQRQSLITEAVTKGLNPNVKMKDSGVEWIGEIPEHWTTSKIKYTAELLNGDRGENYPSGNDFVENGVPFITSHNLNSLFIDNEKSKYISEEKYNLLRGIKIQKNDIIYCLRGSVGKNAIALNDSGAIASSLMGIRAKNNIHPFYLLYVLNSKVEVWNRSLLTTGSVSDNLAAENVGTYIIPFPIMEEQELIVSYLDEKLDDLNQLISSVVKQINAIKEYRQSLIYEAVTGKIDVSEMELEEVR